MKRFNGKTALVTGARSGIGEAIAGRLHYEGATVFTAQRGVDEKFHGITADLSCTEAPGRIIDSVIEQSGRLDILINNAGIMLQGSVAQSSLDDWNRTLQINLTAPFLLIKHAIPHMRSGSSIINIGSIEGLGSNPDHPAYCASKAGLHGLTRAVAVDHGADGIRCNAVAPGWIDTELNVDFINSMADSEQFTRKIGSIHPLGRTGSPAEVAALVTFLASDDASFITGQIVTVDGGRMSKLSLPSV
ncbi:short-chain dehydrogenase [Chromatiales bacterium (ex Bugula neritina AB1)]|nr:short-chain dehydrogenase [Chromatiales bacterium (ex Bugula neritina AB1)]